MATDSQTNLVSRLENLPVELRRQILSILDFEELRTLIHASPTFHDQYRLNRRYILCQCLDTTLRSVAVDAYLVHQSSLPGFKEARSKEAIVRLVKGYQHRLSTEDYSISSENLSEEQVINMITFLSSVIQPLVRQFTSWASTNLAKETTSYQDQPLNKQPLSKTEEIRILRAFYRYQLCCNIFGTPWLYYDSPSVRFYSNYIFAEFMNLVFEPWEIEEIVCIFAFVTNQYDQIFNHLDWKVQEGYRSPQWEYTKDPLILQDSFKRHRCLTGTASHGLEILHNILFQPRTQTQLVSILLENIKQISVMQFFENSGFLSRDEQLQVCTSEERNRARKMQRAEPLLFHGDNEPKLREKHPPLAWTLIWQGTYSNLYGYVIPNHMRLWAYIMWDAVRLEHTGAKDVLIRQFSTKNPKDPRIDIQYWSINRTWQDLDFFS